MKVEFQLNLIGTFYILVAVGLVAAFVFGLINTGFIASTISSPGDTISWLLLSAALTGSLIAVLLLVPVVRRIFKAFMPSA